jgi:hypothetical protein
MPTEQEILEIYRQHEAAALKNHAAINEKMVDAGRERYGQEHFDALSQDLVNTIGQDKVLQLTANMHGLDAPEVVIEHLARHPDEAKHYAAMPPSRQAVALARRESQLSPNIAADGSRPSTQPGWHQPRERVNWNKIAHDPSVNAVVDDGKWERELKAEARRTGKSYTEVLMGR